ncbi:PepSY-associated TM helix domain-containing protein [Pseudomonas aeruginosa]|uniref:PepSY-associated TM helix domain-containing protein n=1 Tax=Pseudomonas aeruginosa TaxID=287 RepID=UPI003CFBEF0D
MLCLTGLPLIFHEEIEHYFEPHPQLEPLTRRVAAHRLRRRDRPRPGRPAGRSGALPGIRKGRPAGPGDQRAEPGTCRLPGERPHAARSTRAPGNSSTRCPPPGGFMYLMLKLHTDLFLGLPGYLFLGLMGLLLVASLVSGVVVYTPFMRKLDFATVRAERSRRLKWLDLHNLLGIVTLSWVTGGRRDPE